MSREIPFDENAICDVCGKKGAFDFMGDYLCDECSSKAIKAEEIEESTLRVIDKSMQNFKIGNVSEPINEKIGKIVKDGFNILKENFDDDVDDDNNVDHTDDLNE